MVYHAGMKSRFDVEFQFGEQKVKGSGNTFLNALKKMKKPKNYDGPVTVKVNGNELSTMFNPLKVGMIFEDPIEMELFAQRLETLVA